MASLYEIDIKGEALTLRTRSFRAGMESVLHSGIFTPELTSSLAAGAVVVAVVAVSVVGGLKFSMLYGVGVVALFVLLFLTLRRFVFYEEDLEARIDKASGSVSVKVRKFMGRSRTYRLSDLSEVRREQVVVSPENPDGVDFVAKIAIQHGTLIPGFGETKTYNTVGLVFRDGSREIVFSSENEDEAKEVSGKLSGFVGSAIAKKD